MAKDMNACHFTGRLAADPEMRYTQNGKAITNFRIAVSGYNDDTLWLSCEAWEKTGEKLNEWMAKGRRIAVSGRLKIDEYEKDGVTHRKAVLVVQDFVPLDKAADGPTQTARSAPQNGAQRATGQTPRTRPVAVSADEDLPF